MAWRRGGVRRSHFGLPADGPTGCSGFVAGVPGPAPGGHCSQVSPGCKPVGQGPESPISPCIHWKARTRTRFMCVALGKI